VDGKILEISSEEDEKFFKEFLSESKEGLFREFFEEFFGEFLRNIIYKNSKKNFGLSIK
jgi:hypothetical protein